MNTTNRTLTFCAVAAFAVLSAVGVKYINRPVVNPDFADVGQEFFSEFIGITTMGSWTRVHESSFVAYSTH